MIGRREFLKVGVAGSVLLACAGKLHAASATSASNATNPAAGAKAGNDEEAAMLAAIANAVLVGMLPADAAARANVLAETAGGVRHAVSGLSLQSQKEVAELFALLTLSPSRRLIAGVSSPWGEAAVEDVAAFLESWRRSRFALLQGAYAALHDLVLGAWYARPETWLAIGYPGTPEVF
ncbi:MAG: hypothetical protein QG590_637 [Pseudomonadota bacterium]|nr:hypothetical protein [Pseudomonadota bacterium]